ncbi:MAG: flagellar basal body P-ring protein FlgI [Rhodospirillaceae bacterium]
MNFLHYRDICALVAGIGLSVFLVSTATAERIKDVSSVAGVRSNQLVGFGLVTGLTGTGDGDINLTKQALRSVISRFGIQANLDDIDAKNIAAVTITAELPPFIKPGQTIDVVVSALGPAESLKGGTLLMSALRGADGETYAVAQGNLAVGGLGVSGDDGSSLIVNVPTVGRIPRGATVERRVETPFLTAENLVLNLHSGDFTVANKVANAINARLGRGIATPIDATSIRVRAPKDPSQRVSFTSLVEEIPVPATIPPAKVIINSRTGTVVIGGNVRITPAAVTHGNLTVKIDEKPEVTPTGATTTTAEGNVVNTPGPAITTPRSKIEADEEPVRAFVFNRTVELNEIVQAINDIGAKPSDLVAILEALKAAGALKAELIII